LCEEESTPNLGAPISVVALCQHYASAPLTPAAERLLRRRTTGWFGSDSCRSRLAAFGPKADSQN
jgi:hypothetical protein